MLYHKKNTINISIHKKYKSCHLCALSTASRYILDIFIPLFNVNCMKNFSEKIKQTFTRFTCSKRVK